MTVLYPNLCYKEVAFIYRLLALYGDIINMEILLVCQPKQMSPLKTYKTKVSMLENFSKSTLRAGVCVVNVKLSSGVVIWMEFLK